MNPNRRTLLTGIALSCLVFSGAQAANKVQFDATAFKAARDSGKPVVLQVAATWCGPCRIVGPFVDELAPSYQGKAIITKMNVDDNPEVAQRYGVTSIPTLMMFKDGKLVDRAVGAMPKSELQKFIDRNL